jgi:hypothetical protein
MRVGPVKAFHIRHGEECYSDGSYFYFADGAFRDRHALGLLAEPPIPHDAEGEWKLESNKLTFAKLRLKAAVAEFETENERLRHFIPNDKDSALANLKRLQRLVEERKNLVAVAEERLSNTHWGKCKERIKREAEETQRRMAEFDEERKAIRI